MTEHDQPSTSIDHHNRVPDDFDASGVTTIGERYEVCAKKCKSWFCEGCAVHKGVTLRERLIPQLATFERCIMITLTVDPKQFESPAAAHAYMQEKRCVSELMKSLKRTGYLSSGRYFCVKEFQKNTKQTHFHLLIDTPFIPIQIVREAWATFVPDSYIRPEGDNSPVFGSVMFSAPRFSDARHAAMYATKYLIKTPDEGWPDWVMQSKRRITRYTTSKGFWPQKEEPEPEYKQPVGHDAPPPCAPTCFCERCRGEEVEPETPETTSISERVDDCCSEAVLLRVEELMTTEGEIIEQRYYEQELTGTPREIAFTLGIQFDGKKRFDVSHRDLKKLHLNRQPTSIFAPDTTMRNIEAKPPPITTTQ